MRLLVAFLLIPLILFAQKGLTFSDEFNGTDVDLAKWVPHDPLAAGGSPNVAAVAGGELHLKQGQAVTTFGLFSQVYGRFEIRCRLPLARGTRARFRLLPVPLAPLPAIDVFAAEGTKVWFGNYWGTEQTERSFGDSFDLPPAGLHVFAIEWDRTKITWSMDGKDKLHSVDGVPSLPMFLQLEGPMDVDYIHVFPAKLN
jgi:beta-glucanase (GH16 family)